MLQLGGRFCRGPPLQQSFHVKFKVNSWFFVLHVACWLIRDWRAFPPHKRFRRHGPIVGGSPSNSFWTSCCRADVLDSLSPSRTSGVPPDHCGLSTHPGAQHETSCSAILRRTSVGVWHFLLYSSSIVW